LNRQVDDSWQGAIIFSVRSILAVILVFLILGCAPAATPTPLLTVEPPPPTPVAIPTSSDVAYNEPVSYSRKLGDQTQRIQLGVSSDFATRPILPFFGLSLTDEKFADRLFQVITYNHFFRWQEADWGKRAAVKYDDFKARLASGEDLSYPAMDTRTGGANAHIEKINPAADLEILLIPHHDGFVTFPGSESDPGLSIKNTINPDGSITVRAPLVYSQVITFNPGDAGIQDIARTAILLALMETGIPSEAILNNDVKAINTWWQTKPEADLHTYQYEYLKKLLTDDQGKSILRVWDEKPTSQ